MINSRKVEDLHPKVQELCNKHIAACKARGVIIQVTNTLRDAEYQAYLYSLGRTKPGSIVTNMKLIGPHGFRLAYDVVPLVNGKAQWDNTALWQIAGEEGKKLGLTWGGDWKSIVDKPHFEYTGGLKAADLRAGKRPSWWEVSIVADKFSDISKHWAKEKILKAVELELMSGDGDNTFDPDKPVTRAQLAVVAVNIFDKLNRG
jgi:peptidoglycan L-alanyl-D-glutamate endopeptidase CwlK